MTVCLLKPVLAPVNVRVSPSIGVRIVLVSLSTARPAQSRGTRKIHYTESRFVIPLNHHVSYTHLAIIKHWVDGHFTCTSLKDLGLRIQLGHPVWGQCCNPSPAFHDDFIVLDVNGVHQVAVDFCACETAQSPTTQLLRARWFPATTIDPKTAATFRLLHHFHILTFESKASAFEVWQTLSRLTDNTGIRTPKVSKSFPQYNLLFSSQIWSGSLRGTPANGQGVEKYQTSQAVWART